MKIQKWIRTVRKLLGLPRLPLTEREIAELLEKGPPAEQYTKGVLYKYGIGECVPQNHALAMQLFHAAAKQNLPKAQFELGLCYCRPAMGEFNPELSFKWIKEAADRHFHKAFFVVGTAYESGMGVQKDWNEALKWYHKAAHIGDLYAIGRLTALEAGVEEDDEEDWELD